MATFILAGCEKDLSLEKYRDPSIEKMLVVNSILNPDSAICVSVTHPYFFSDTHKTFRPVEGLDISVGVNGRRWGSMTFDDDKRLYSTDLIPAENDIVSLEIGRGKDVVNCCDTVPARVSIDDVKVTGEGPIHIYWDDDYRFTYKITFSDPPHVENYYFLTVEDGAAPYEFTLMGQVDYTNDYVFQILANSVNKELSDWQPEEISGYPFSDKGIDGRQYTITVTEVLQTPIVSMIERLPRKIKLFAISKPYYEYMVSVLSMDYDGTSFKGNLLSLGLIEPSPIFTNISGGTGIMGSYSLSSIDVDILQLAGGWPAK